MTQLNQILNKFMIMTRQPRSYGIDVVEHKNFNYSYHRIKNLLKKDRDGDDDEKEHMGSKPTLWKVARLESLNDGRRKLESKEGTVVKDKPYPSPSKKAPHPGSGRIGWGGSQHMFYPHGIDFPIYTD